MTLFSCRQAKYVPDGYYLINDNEVAFKQVEDGEVSWEKSHDLLNKGEMKTLIRPQPNSKIRLFIYNRIDSARYQKQLERKREKFKRKNEKKQEKVERKNQKRIEKARKKDKDFYKKKEFTPKPTRLGWRHWVIDNWGEEPILLDTGKVSRSRQQLRVYLSQRGFKYAEVHDSIKYNEKKQKAEVTYYVNPGKPYRIHSFKVHDIPRNSQIKKLYQDMVRKEYTDIRKGDLLDEKTLEKEREHFVTFLKDNAYFGFTSNYVNFIVDTTVGNYQADVVMYIKEKTLPDPNNPDTTITTNHHTYLVNDVYYKLYNTDSASFDNYPAFIERCNQLGISPIQQGKYALLDTLFIQDTVIYTTYLNLNSNRRKDHDLKVFQKFTDTNIYYKGYFIFNEKPFVNPDLLDKQNFLEHTSSEEKHYAKDYYIDRTYKSFLRLGVFSRITPIVEITPGKPLGNTVDATYELTPSPRQQFTIEPRATNTSSILGISGMVSYKNKNLFRTANQLEIKVEGGFQSQPLVVGGDTEGSKVLQFRGLNTFEWGPEINYEIPKFFPMSRTMQENISKRSFPSTNIGVLYNYQKRVEFIRHISEFSYRWKFHSADQTQIFTVTPLRFDYIFLDKDPEFDDRLNATNDPFLINSYSDFFSLGILNFSHEYTNARLKDKDRKSKHVFSNTFILTASGLILNTIYALSDDELNFKDAFSEDGKELFAVPYSQYGKIENTFIFNQKMKKKHSLVYRLITGLGVAYGNAISLPYTQSFVAGGSNDIRAFDARTMAPGATQTYTQPNATSTQIGDVKLELNVEWRFKIGGIFHGAIFTDVGNIWKLNPDPNNPNDLGVFNFDTFYKQVAIGTGFGVRADLEFLILRVDFSWAIHNPYLDPGERWWLTGPKDNYLQYFKTDADGDPVNYVSPHGLNINFGIGYPF
ncbi:MAG: BamA/TamA family outer membrane protein [Crocinitomicaceae bacterium]